ncbi:NUDIX hydrolase [Streptomyces sp. NPDC057697]|uniref:NUDIX hydrolase n=1 Tax=Streptomyces sp. NPDC057697 TaxID=3346219 RepID=UPI0036A9FE35
MAMPESIELRCSTALFREETVLLLHRTFAGMDYWVLPGGTPQERESMAACARRELAEEAGISAEPVRVAFVLESMEPHRGPRTVDLVFTVTGSAHGQTPRAREPDTEPQFVPFRELPYLDLRPPLAGHLPGLAAQSAHRYAPYLGNLWRPGPESVGTTTSADTFSRFLGRVLGGAGP